MDEHSIASRINKRLSGEPLDDTAVDSIPGNQPELEAEGTIHKEIGHVAVSQSAELLNLSERTEQFYRELDGLSKSALNQGELGAKAIESSYKNWQHIKNQLGQIYRAQEVEVDTGDTLRSLTNDISDLSTSLSQASEYVGTSFTHSRHLEQAAVDAHEVIEGETHKTAATEVARRYEQSSTKTNNISNRIREALELLPILEAEVREAAHVINDVRSYEDRLSQAFRKLIEIDGPLVYLDEDMDLICDILSKTRADINAEIETIQKGN